MWLRNLDVAAGDYLCVSRTRIASRVRRVDRRLCDDDAGRILDLDPVLIAACTRLGPILDVHIERYPPHLKAAGVQVVNSGSPTGTAYVFLPVIVAL